MPVALRSELEKNPKMTHKVKTWYFEDLKRYFKDVDVYQARI